MQIIAKLYIIIFPLLFGFSLTFVSCSKTDEVSTGLNSLLPAKYDFTPDTEKSSVFTNVTAVDPATGLLKREYLVIVQKSAVFSKAALMRDHNI